ncbi:hypothetical protein GCM10009550_72190 [Actinocorallia libanotica]|uniref:Uncharacterized protein n=1 Tax=Actinocorallia libanotica TaxID=46162 RepID=A0ABN1RYD9_9ACTN
MPHHSAQPACIDGIAAYWLAIAVEAPEEYRPGVSKKTTGSTKPCSGRKRGGASG